MENTIQELLSHLENRLSPLSETPSLDAQVLVANHLGKSRSWLLSHPETALSNAEYQHIQQSVQLLEQGKPLPYILGHWEFYGLDFLVTPDVLIPRPETELLVERALIWLQKHPHRRTVLDVGTGSGCIGITIARHIPSARVVLADISAKALDVAHQNAKILAQPDQLVLIQSDLLDNVEGPFDLIIANLPYIPSQVLDMLPVGKREPRQALDGGVDGLSFIGRLIRQAQAKINPGGLLLLEIDPDQCERVLQLVHEIYPNVRAQILHDLAGRDRCVEVELHHVIYHLCPRRDWLNGVESGEYRADSLALEGFIHCSEISQVAATANRYYQDVPDLVMLWIDLCKLTSEIQWEKSGSEYYPHIYGPINLQAVSRVTDFHPASDGIYRLDNAEAC